MSLLLTLTMLHGLFSICLMMLTKSSTLGNGHAPIVKKRVKLMPLLPWINNDILQLMHRGDQFKARAKSNILAGIMYKRLRY